mgnify:CR=1 FL=1
MKRFLLSLAVITFALGANAQSDINFGVKAGLNLSSLKMSAEGISASFDTKVGFHVGGFAEINVAESFAIQPELMYSTAGAKLNTGGMKATTNLSYISVPVLAKYKVSGFGVYLGPEVGFLASAKSKSDGESYDDKDSYKSINFSGVLGAEYTLESGLGFNARYVAGLANIAKDAEGDQSLKANNIMIGVHYRF